MFSIVALLFIVGIPGVISYLISLFTYKRLVKAGKSRPKRMRNIVFSVSYVLLLAAEVVLLLNSLTFDR